ncbi:MAG: RNA-binding protein [Bacteroidales bacterium]|nr:RNA-binding protein [Bacteroidales bacterium]HPD95693.1 RNA-binding protein [Tenuifilaceae bacterium]HRX32086.1 RNA-binding protein [Tenuifilaceae bacterium]
MMIYVGNIAYSMTAEELKELFTPFGNVLSVKIIVDKMSGRSKGYGFVEMESDEDGVKAIQSLNDSQVKGRNIKVNNAFRKSDVKPDEAKPE